MKSWAVKLLENGNRSQLEHFVTSTHDIFALLYLHFLSISVALRRNMRAEAAWNILLPMGIALCVVLSVCVGASVH